MCTWSNSSSSKGNFAFKLVSQLSAAYHRSVWNKHTSCRASTLSSPQLIRRTIRLKFVCPLGQSQPFGNPCVKSWVESSKSTYKFTCTPFLRSFDDPGPNLKVQNYKITLWPQDGKIKYTYPTSKIQYAVREFTFEIHEWYRSSEILEESVVHRLAIFR